MPKPVVVAPSTQTSFRIVEAIDIAARHLVYKLYDATDGAQGAWQMLGQIGERPATIARAVERGWVIVRDDRVGKATVRSASLTSQGRVLARRGLA